MKVIHECWACRKTGVWDIRWRWFGSWRDFDNGGKIIKLCSLACGDLAIQRRCIAPLTDAERENWQAVGALSDAEAALLIVIRGWDGIKPKDLAEQSGIDYTTRAYRYARRKLLNAGLIRVDGKLIFAT